MSVVLVTAAEREAAILNNTDGIFSFDAHSIPSDYESYSNPYYSIDYLGRRAVNTYANEISASSAKYGVDQKLVESIVYLENSHGWYDGFILSPSTIRPGNINIDKWSGLLPEYTTEQIKEDPAKNIELSVKLLSEIQRRIPNSSVESVASLGSGLVLAS